MERTRRRLKLTDVNEHLICMLCNGYFVDATTIVECLHSFCRSCLIKYLENNSYCPICEVQIHKAKPFLNIKPDEALQDIVYKLVPGLFHSEMKRRREFYSRHPEQLSLTTPEERGVTVERIIFSPDESISLSLEYLDPDREKDEWESLSSRSSESGVDTCEAYSKRYLLCPAQVTVAHLKKFLRLKYELRPDHVVELVHRRESLSDEYTLMDIAYIYTWKRNSPMRFFYRIYKPEEAGGEDEGPAARRPGGSVAGARPCRPAQADSSLEPMFTAFKTPWLPAPSSGAAQRLAADCRQDTEVSSTSSPPASPSDLDGPPTSAAKTAVPRDAGEPSSARKESAACADPTSGGGPALGGAQPGDSSFACKENSVVHASVSRHSVTVTPVAAVKLQVPACASACSSRSVPARGAHDDSETAAVSKGRSEHFSVTGTASCVAARLNCAKEEREAPLSKLSHLLNKHQQVLKKNDEIAASSDSLSLVKRQLSNNVSETLRRKLLQHSLKHALPPAEGEDKSSAKKRRPGSHLKESANGVARSSLLAFAARADKGGPAPAPAAQRRPLQPASEEPRHEENGKCSAKAAAVPVPASRSLLLPAPRCRTPDAGPHALPRLIEIHSPAARPDKRPARDCVGALDLSAAPRRASSILSVAQTLARRQQSLARQPPADPGALLLRQQLELQRLWGAPAAWYGGSAKRLEQLVRSLGRGAPPRFFPFGPGAASKP